MPTAANGQPYVVTGRVVKPYGVRGWVKVEAYTTNPSRFSTGNSFILEGAESGERLILEEAQAGPGVLRIKFKGLDTREQAEGIAGKLLLVTPKELGESPSEGYWEHQLIGLDVRTLYGRVLGEVTEIMETGANDVLVVSGEQEYLIPMTSEVVVKIDLEDGIIHIDPIPGLLED